jgi:hypothetical protein
MDLIMDLVCEACGSSHKYSSDRGLRQHQLNCQEFLLADNEASTVDDALAKYQRKLQRRKRKLEAASDPNEAVPLTGSDVHGSFNFYSTSILIHSRMDPWWLLVV